jgi:phosphopantetheine adenylyltransferase
LRSLQCLTRSTALIEVPDSRTTARGDEVTLEPESVVAVPADQPINHVQRDLVEAGAAVRIVQFRDVLAPTRRDRRLRCISVSIETRAVGVSVKWTR